MSDCGPEENRERSFFATTMQRRKFVEPTHYIAQLLTIRSISSFGARNIARQNRLNWLLADLEANY